MVPTVPITIKPEAAAHVGELGMQAELDRMIQHTWEVVPDVQQIEVQLSQPYDLGDDPRVIIECTRASCPEGYDPTEGDWGAWKVHTFPPDVCRHFVMLVTYEAPDAR